MTRRLIAPLRDSPIALPALAALALFVAWSLNDDGYPLTHWAPGGLILLALVAIALGLVGWSAGGRSPAVKLALACLAAYAAWSFLSMLWAPVSADAWEGGDRALLYLLVFLLFAGFPLRAAGAALLLCAWVAALIGVGAYVLVHLGGLSPAGIAAAFPGGRLVYPAGYANAAAAQWMMAAWPALLLARSRSLRPALRGVLAGGAVLLSDLALLSLSRGALLASGVMVVLVFLLVPGRLRTFAVMVPVALGVGLSAPLVLRVGDRLEAGLAYRAAVQAARSALHGAELAIFLAGAAVALAVWAASRLDTAPALSPRRRLALRRLTAALAAGTAVAAVAGGLAVAGDPVARLRHAWETFKSPRGYEADASGNRLTGGLGSNRYDFYRVALEEFAAHPLLGDGSENFSQQYLRRGRSSETPRYPHSVELRTMSETGIVGTLLAVVGLGAALLAGARAMRRGAPLAGTVAAAALAGFAYWAVHGSADWFWEYAGLAAPAFALLGLACALDPAPRRRSAAAARGLRLDVPRGLLAACLVLAALAGAAAFSAPWLSGLQVQSAAHVWLTAPASAYARLDSAAALDPLSAEPYLVAGSVALRRGELARADRLFARALARSPDDEYATLERGTIASQRGEAANAERLLTRALRLYPRDRLAAAVLGLTRAGRRVTVGELDSAILGAGQRLE